MKYKDIKLAFINALKNVKKKNKEKNLYTIFSIQYLIEDMASKKK